MHARLVGDLGRDVEVTQDIFDPRLNGALASLARVSRISA